MFAGERGKLGVLAWLAVMMFATLACSGLIVVRPAQTPPPPASAAPLPQAQPEASAAATGAAFPTRLVAESINLDTPVVAMDWQTREQGGQAVSVWNVPENEAGWHLNSAPPGAGTNVVISGHNGSTGGHVFGRLEDLAVGDVVMVWAGQSVYTYQVSRREIVRTFGASQSTLDYLQQLTRPTVQEQLTVITCWPNWTNTHRLIIVAQPV
jgi:LPXTG-site transpeptidase (sortase) family protein